MKEVFCEDQDFSDTQPLLLISINGNLLPYMMIYALYGNLCHNTFVKSVFVLVEWGSRWTGCWFSGVLVERGAKGGWGAG